MECGRNAMICPAGISYLATDFTNVDLDWLGEGIRQILQGLRSFILIGGVLFFLAREDTVRLFHLFAAIQGPGEFVGSVSFTRDLERTRVFKKLIKYVENNLEKNQRFEYQTLENTFYEKLPGYKLTDQQNTFTQAKIFVSEKPVEKDEVVTEHMYILKKNNNGY